MLTIATVYYIDDHFLLCIPIVVAIFNEFVIIENINRSIQNRYYLKKKKNPFRILIFHVPTDIYYYYVKCLAKRIIYSPYIHTYLHSIYIYRYMYIIYTYVYTHVFVIWMISIELVYVHGGTYNIMEVIIYLMNSRMSWSGILLTSFENIYVCI